MSRCNEATPKISQKVHIYYSYYDIHLKLFIKLKFYIFTDFYYKKPCVFDHNQRFTKPPTYSSLYNFLCSV